MIALSLLGLRHWELFGDNPVPHLRSVMSKELEEPYHRTQIEVNNQI
jgi:hypothetical protein